MSLRHPRVALESSGKELRGSEETLAEGQIHDSSRPMLAALPRRGARERGGCRWRPTSVEAVRAALGKAADCVVVVTTAGISVAEEDHVRDAVGALGGSLCVLKVAMKPRKPLATGRPDDALFLGLPGNPPAAPARAVGFRAPAARAPRRRRAQELAMLASPAAEVRRCALLDVHPFLAAAIKTE